MFRNEDYDEYTGLRCLGENVGIRDIPRDERVDITIPGLNDSVAAMTACACRQGFRPHERLKIGIIKGLYRYNQALCGAGGDSDALLDDFSWEPDAEVCAERQAWFEELLQLAREGVEPRRWPLWRFENEVAKAFEKYLVACGDGLMTKSAVELAVSDTVIDVMYHSFSWLRKHYPELLETKSKTAEAA